MQGGGYQLAVPPLTAMVKKLVIINLTVWVVLVLILQKWVLDAPYIYQWFGFIPESVLLDFWIWQPITYMFLHSDNVFHVLFNMLILWFFGSELEARWGGRFFLLYYMVCGVGAAVLYLAGVTIYSLASGDALPLKAPVVGASGAVFGLMLAYGKVFGDRVIYLLGVFPMKARIFVAVIAAIEVLTLLSSGVHSQTANLAHIGGLAVGFVFLNGLDRWQTGRRRKATQSRGRNLKLVVNNEKPDQERNPKFWN